VPTEDGFVPEHPLPLFLSRRVDKQERRESPLLLNASIFVITAALVGIAMAFSLENRVKVFADIKASLTETSAAQPDAVQSTPTTQSTAAAQALPLAARGAPTRDQLVDAIDPPGQSQTEINETPSGALLKQFQAWAAEQDARAQVESERPLQRTRAEVEPVRPVQDARAQDLLSSQNAQAPDRSIQKHRKVRPVQNARAEIRPPRNPQDARGQDQSVQNAQAPSFLQGLGWHQ